MGKIMDIVELAKTVKKPLPGTAKGKMYKGFWTPRHITQLGFAALNVWLGFLFWGFVRALDVGGDGPLPPRTAGVEGWLPISGLMGVINWISEGTINRVHPASAILLLSFIAIAFLARKAFCSWVCPIGTISEGLAMLGRKLFGKTFLLPRSRLLSDEPEVHYTRTFSVRVFCDGHGGDREVHDQSVQSARGREDAFILHGNRDNRIDRDRSVVYRECVRRRVLVPVYVSLRRDAGTRVVGFAAKNSAEY